MATTSLSLNIASFVQKTRAKADLVLRKLALDCLAGVIRRSPVDTGRFRASWRVGINVVDLATIPGSKVGMLIPAAVALTSGTASINVAKIGDAIFISNNLPYAERIENGWSQQAPQGVMKNTFQEVVSGFATVVAQVESEGV